MSRATTWLPIVCGGLVGAWFALAGARSEPARNEGAAATSTEAEPIPPLEQRASGGASAAGAASRYPTAPAARAAAPSVSRGAPPSPAEARDAWPRAFLLTAPASEKELLAAQVRCNRKAPEDCERAALGLDAGLLLTRDADRATKLRRMAVTLYVRQCESGRVLACARLAEMYSTGDQLRQNERSARALRDRVTTLCASSKKQQADCSAVAAGARRDG